MDTKFMDTKFMDTKFIDTETKEDLIKYVIDQKTTYASNQRIKKFCETQKPESLILYRGHKNSTKIRPNIWYSASKSKEIAIEEFSSGKGKCCVFKIHLIDIPIIDINKLIGSKIGKYAAEKEVIFLGGGIFYEDETLSKEGFKDNGNGEYEGWYKMNIAKPLFDLERILTQIPEDEYEFIDSPSDIKILTVKLTTPEKRKVFDKIQEIKNKKSTETKKPGTDKTGTGSTEKRKKSGGKKRKRKTKKHTNKRKKYL